MKGKTIIFGAPNKDLLTEKIISNLKFIGFEVIDISFDQNFKYKRFSDKVYNFLRKTFFRDTTHKKRLRFESERENIYKKLSVIDKSEYALIIRPDIYPKEFIKFLKTKTKKLIGYQWDGMNRFPEIKRYTKYFDSFFVFDEDDVSDRLLPTTNFYFDNDLKEYEKKDSKKRVFFIGTFMKNRVEPFMKISEKLKSTKFENSMFLYSKNKKIQKKFNKMVNITDRFLSLSECEKMSESSDVLVDILNNVHNGLSFRTFEAIKLKKKLITNNPSIKKYDFYNPNNILVLENDMNYDVIPDFLNLEYEELPTEIYEKYSFTNWIKYILDIKPYQSITLPKIN